MDGYIVGSMISANSIVGEQIQANSIKAANLEVDVQKKIESATDEETVKTLIKADLDGFEVNVSNTYETKADSTSKFDDVNNSISALTGRISSAESKITDEAITNTVKQNFYTKTETDNAITSQDYQTSSQVQQTVNNLQIKFTESGGYNMLKNGSFMNGINIWNIKNSATTENDTSCPYGTEKSRLIYSTNTWSGIYQDITFVVGKTYSWSAHVKVEKGSVYVGVEGISSKTINGYTASWQTASGTFVATKTSHRFVVTNTTETSATIRVHGCMVCYGQLPQQYTPHPSEIYDGITTIDKNGIAVKHSNANSTSYMNANGFAVVRNSDNKDLFRVNGGNLTMEGTLATGTSGQYIKASDGDYKVYEGGTLKGFLGFRNTSNYGMTYDVPKIWLGASGISTGNSYLAVCDYKATGNPQNYGYGYADIAYRVPSKEDWSNIKMYGDGMMRIAPVQALEITSNYSNGSYGGTGENLIAKFTTSSNSLYDGHLQVGAVHNTSNNNGLILGHWRESNRVHTMVRVNSDSEGNKMFRPCDANADVYLGSSGFRWKVVYAANGSVQTSDNRYKMKMGQLNTGDCYEMVKNTDLYKYCMLPKSKDNMSADEMKKTAKKASNDDSAIQTGIMAQDILKYDCSRYILTHETWIDEETNTEKEMYNINPYAFSTAIMGALKEEINKREALEKRVEILEEKLNQLISLQK